MRKYIPKEKHDLSEKLSEHVDLSIEHQNYLSKLAPEEIADLFFSLLKNRDNISAISQKMVDMGFEQNNLVFKGRSDIPGDQISFSRWLKAAAGSLIIPIRYDENNDIQVLFGKNVDNIWVLPGGHYELDDHKNLDHTFIAELMEETGIIPYSEKFLPYIEATLSHAKDILPYGSVQEAGENFVSKRFSWVLETVLSGADLGYKKRIIIAVYSIIFHDGSKLQPRAADDLNKLQWFSLKQIIEGDNKVGFNLSDLVPAHYDALKYSLTRLKYL